MRILIAVFLLSFCSCISQRKCAERYPPQEKDSVIEKETIVYRDTTITLPGDSVQIFDTIPCPDVLYNKTVTSSGGRTTATVSLKNGRLQVDCKADSMQLVIDSLATVIKQKEHYQVRTVTVTKTITKEVVPAWCWWMLAAGIAYLIFRFKAPLGKAATFIFKLLKFVIILWIVSCWVDHSFLKIRLPVKLSNEPGSTVHHKYDTT